MWVRVASQSTPFTVYFTTPLLCLVGNFPIPIKIHVLIATLWLTLSLSCFPSMVHMRGLKDENSESEGQSPLDAPSPSSSSLQPKSLLKGRSGLLTDLSSRSGLAIAIPIAS